MAKVVLACFFVFVAAVCMIGVAAADGTTWCVANPSANDTALQGNIDFACDKPNTGVDCSNIQKDGICFNPNTVYNHASVAMNMYYQKNKRLPSTCNFNNRVTGVPTGLVTTNDPSQGSCKYATA